MSVDLHTGSFASGLTWDITKGNQTILSGGDYQSNTDHTYVTCLEACDEESALDLYTFNIAHTLSFGFAGGSYSVTVDDIVVVRGGDSFGLEDSTDFQAVHAIHICAQRDQCSWAS